VRETETWLRCRPARAYQNRSVQRRRRSGNVAFGAWPPLDRMRLVYVYMIILYKVCTILHVYIVTIHIATANVYTQYTRIYNIILIHKIYTYTYADGRIPRKNNVYIYHNTMRGQDKLNFQRSQSECGVAEETRCFGMKRLVQQCVYSDFSWPWNVRRHCIISYAAPLACTTPNILYHINNK